MTLTDYYQQLFGKVAIQDGNVIDFAEHGRVGGVSTGQGVKYVQILDVSGDIVDSFGGAGGQATVTAIQGLGGSSAWLMTMATLPVMAGQIGTWAIASLPTLSVNAFGNLASLTAFDFATQTTLAQIKARTDNIDVALSTRTKPSDVQSILGTVTANQGGLWSISSLPTLSVNAFGNMASLTAVDFAKETGGNLAGAATSLAVMDDWDNGASDGASISGDVAHDTADAGEPVKMGMKAVALKTNPTEVAANDRTNWYADVSGVPFVLGGHPNILTQSLQITDADGAQTDTAIITAGANVAIVVTKISAMADNANTGDVSVRIGFGTANTPAADAAQVLLFHPGIAPGSGVVEGSGSGILGIGASNEDVRITCEDPAGGSVNVIVTYFTTDI